MDSLRASQASRALGWLLALLALSSLWRFGDAWPGIDYYQFWLVGRALDSQVDLDPYPAATREALGAQGVALARAQQGNVREASLQLKVAEYRRALEVYSSPLLYSVVGKLSVGDYERDKRLWQRSMLLCYALALLCAALALGWSWSQAGLCIAVACVANEALFAELGNGNVNALLALNLGLCLLLGSHGRWTLAAACFGLGLCFKPLLLLAPLPLLLRWAWARQFSLVLRAVLGLGAGLMLGVLSAKLAGHPWSLWSSWWTAAQQLAQNSGEYPDNFAPLAWLKAEVWSGTQAWMLWSLAAAGCVWRAWRSRSQPSSDREALHLLAFGALLALVLTPLVWIHYVLLAMPWVLALILHGRWWMAGLAWVSALCLASQPLTQLCGWRTHAERSSAVVLALLLLALLGLWKCEAEHQQ